MGAILALSSAATFLVAGLAIALIIWFFWWQHTRAMMYDDAVDEVHHHYYDDDDYDESEVHHYHEGDEGRYDGSSDLDLDAVRVGATVEIRNYPEQGDRTRFKASQRNRYELQHGGAAHIWYEFKLLGPNEATWLEWEHDDGLVITQWSEEEIPLSSLGVTVDELREMQSQGGGTLKHDGTRYNFVNSAEARCFENDGVEGADFTSWTFEDDNEEQLLSVMLWPGTGGSATGRPGWYLDPDEVQLA